MLTKLTIRNFKLFENVDIELGERVLLIGPNNAGKTSALQALALWKIGLDKWIEKRGTGPVPEKRPGVTINRKDFISVPIPVAKLVWHNLSVRKGVKQKEGKSATKNILIEIIVEGVNNGAEWRCGLEFDYANEESVYCRPLRMRDGSRMEIPDSVSELVVAFLPPMSGLTATETKIDAGAINVRIGEGRTAEVLRNLCLDILKSSGGETKWAELNDHMEKLFGVTINDPIYKPERGEITLDYKDKSGVTLDISASGRGQQQTLLLLSYMLSRPGSILLLDEPDAHLEILRQRQIYKLLSNIADKTGVQILAASHSEVLLNEAADRDVVVAFVGLPHRIDNKGSQVKKALRDIGFEHYYQAEERGWVLYLEGSTDLAILQGFAHRLKHPAEIHLDAPFVHYVSNQPKKANEHFFALREAKPDLVGIAIYDRLEHLPNNPPLQHLMWTKCEIENYLCQRETLLKYAYAKGVEQGPLFAKSWQDDMEEVITDVESALHTLGDNPWGKDIKASEKFLDIVFDKFFKKLNLYNLMPKKSFHILVNHVPKTEISQEISEKLNAIVKAAKRANSSI